MIRQILLNLMRNKLTLLLEMFAFSGAVCLSLWHKFDLNEKNLRTLLYRDIFYYVN